MNETYAVYVIRLAKEATRDAALGLYAISILAAFILVQIGYPDGAMIDIITNFMAGSIVMLVVHILLQFIYTFEKDQMKKTVKEPEEIDEESDT